MTAFRRLALIAVAAACAAAAAPALAQQKLDFILNWVPGGDHAPYFYAKKMGWYKDAGLDVNLEPGKGSAVAVQKVAAGANQLGLADMPNALTLRGKGADTVGVFNVYANSPQGLYWLKSSGIKSVKDLAGKKIGNPAGDGARTIWPALAKANGMDAELGHLGQHRRQLEAGGAEGALDRRDDLVLQHPPHLQARARRRHGLRRLEGRRPQHLRQHGDRQRRLPEEEQGGGRRLREGHAESLRHLRGDAQALRAGADRRQRRAQLRQRDAELGAGRAR